MRAYELLREDAQSGLTLVLTKCYDAVEEDEGYYEGPPGFEFDILRNGQKVGDLWTGDQIQAQFVGRLDGKLLKLNDGSVLNQPDYMQVERSRKAQRVWTEYAQDLLNKHTSKVVSESVLLEGGNAFPDVGSIHISEVEPTLKSLAQAIGVKEVVDQALGSAGKSEYSGDIDVALDVTPEQMKELSHKIRAKLGNQSVVGVAGNVSIRMPIVDFDKTKQGRKPRTGFVQIDLIPGKPEWLKTFYHSPGDTSKLKGVHRNMALTSVAKHIDTQASAERDDQDRPIEEVRWSWGPKGGLQRVRKKSKPHPKGGWTKKQETEVLGDSTTDPKTIAKIMFRGKAGSDALHSVETVIDAVKKAYNKQEQESIYKEMARMYIENDLVDGFDIPAEVKKYV